MNAPEKAVAEPSPAQAPYWLTTLIGTLLALAGGVVTTFFGLFVCLYVIGRIGGAHPAPELTILLVVWAMFGGLPLAAGIALLGNSRSRRIWWRALAVMSLVSVAAAIDGSFGPTNWHHIFAREKLAGTDASKLQRTMVSPHLEVPIAPGKNVLWCGTFQLAWNEACRLTGGDLQFNQVDPMITTLNKHTFTRESVDEASYVAMAGFVRDNIHSKIQAAIETKFHGTFKPRFMPERGRTGRPGYIDPPFRPPSDP